MVRRCSFGAWARDRTSRQRSRERRGVVLLQRRRKIVERGGGGGGAGGDVKTKNPACVRDPRGRHCPIHTRNFWHLIVLILSVINFGDVRLGR